MLCAVLVSSALIVKRVVKVSAENRSKPIPMHEFLGDGSNRPASYDLEQHSSEVASRSNDWQVIGLVPPLVENE